MSCSGKVLWWGRFDPDYSRNRVLRQAFHKLGWGVVDFRPFSSLTGDLEATFRNIPRPDLVWVPSFRQRDVAAASRWARKTNVPLVFDPLISSYDKQVFERQLIREGSARARRLLRWEQKLFHQPDLLVADTSAHADYFYTAFGVSNEKVVVVPVGAEEELFCRQELKPENGHVEVLFYGTFIDLQGPKTIVEAASRCTNDNVTWTMLGAGPLLSECREMAHCLNANNLRFESWVQYEALPERIGCADILLGVFGESRKAASVIPNKVYQALACGRPVITRKSTAYPPEVSSVDSPGLIQIEPGQPDRLVEMVADLADSYQRRLKSSENARSAYEEFFSSDAISVALKTAVQKLTR